MRIEIIFYLIILISLIGVLFPLIMSLKKSTSLVTKIMTFFLLLIVELLLLLLSIIINVNQENTILDYLPTNLLVLLVLFGFSCTLIISCIEDNTSKAKQIMKFSALLSFGLSILLAIVIPYM